MKIHHLTSWFLLLVEIQLVKCEIFLCENENIIHFINFRIILVIILISKESSRMFFYP